MPDICLCFHLHIPTFLKPYKIFNLGLSHDYFDEIRTIEYLNEIADTCLIPANVHLKSILENYDGKFKIGLGLSGPVLRLIEEHRPDVLKSFQALMASGHVELLGQNDDHAFSFMYDRQEYQRQLEAYSDRVRRLFGQELQVMMTTAGLYSNPMGYYLQKMGYKGILCGGNEEGLKGRNTHQLFHPTHLPKVKLLLADEELTQAVEHDFSINNLDAAGMANWISGTHGQVLHILWDYKILGHLHKKETGIFDFVKHFPEILMAKGQHRFLTPAELFAQYSAEETYDMPKFTTRNSQRVSYVSNFFQQEALMKLYEIKASIVAAGDPHLLDTWQKLQDAFYVYKMGKMNEDSETSYSHFLNIITDMNLRVKELVK